jgi:ATP-binding cassette subfamily F protein 3
LHTYAGGYDYYGEKTAAASAAAARQLELQSAHRRAAENRKVDDRRNQRRIQAEARQTLSRQRREQENLVRDLESRIHALEQRQAELTDRMQHPDTYAQAEVAVETQREFTAGVLELKRLNAQWEEAAIRLTKLESSALPSSASCPDSNGQRQSP